MLVLPILKMETFLVQVVAAHLMLVSQKSGPQLIWTNKALYLISLQVEKYSEMCVPGKTCGCTGFLPDASTF